MHNTILQRVKRRPAPASYFHHLFKIFQTPSPGEVIKIYPFKSGGGQGSELCQLIGSTGTDRNIGH